MASILALPAVDARWRERLPLLLVALLAALAAQYATLADMVGIWWHSSTFNHCFLILPIALGLGWTRRAEVTACAPGLSWWGVGYALANGLLWLAGATLSIAFLQHVALVGLVIGVGWALIGNAAFRVLLVPFLYLYFSVPEGEFLVPRLQDWTAEVLVSALQLTGIPVYVEGRHLTIPSGSFVVAEACSGINYLIATLAVGTMYMYLNFRSPWRRAAFMGLAIAVPLIANGLRAYGIVMIAHLSDYKYALGIDHFIYGWVFFGIVIFALFALGNRFSDIDPDLPAPAVAPAASRATSRAAPLAPVLVALAAAAFAPPLLVHAASANRPLAPAIALPTVADWQGPRDERLDLGAERAGADQSLAGVYQAADQSVVWLTLDYFRGEGPGKELVNQAQRGFDPKRWQQLDYGVAFPAPASGVAQANAVRLRQLASGEEYLLWSWYDTNAQRSSARLAVKMAQAGARLRGGPVGGAVVTVATRVEGGADGAAVLNRFLASGAVAIERLHVAP